ncbi:MAG: AMMECR1 domain-containing protein [Candidatus Muproteobacteria bacterium RBG_16_60_9]|uniref:AMMECR1 domain-containing protein n=1 Tax=Candidatus Muproteobacteria bacterium RBG_16_60_9 TaxID=1817755 RepID=A0A1F6VDR5_9PROT|nr:MAG: AMMECR1 domain-containing protein [Candidatus Muproteobacteria bacterium RBG_16_60_9]
MALTSSSNVIESLDTADRRVLLDVARAAIADGLQGRPAAVADLDAHAWVLRRHAATFVTLEIGGELRGCIGTLDAFQPLIVDTAENAYAAAFRDPRFAPLTATEFERLAVHISILGAAEPMAFISEDDLLAQLRPGIDGLILSENGRRGTFLPAVWESVADPRDFLGYLKLKAGLPRDYWSDTVQISRYITTSIF